MFKLLLLSLLLIPGVGSAAHLALNIRCVTVTPEAKVNLQFQVVRRNKLHRLTVGFEAAKGGTFKAGDDLDVVIDGETVATVKLKSQGEKLVGKTRKQGFDPDFDIDAKRGSVGTMGGLTCTFKR
jgi:hypothetical protein